MRQTLHITVVQVDLNVKQCLFYKWTKSYIVFFFLTKAPSNQTVQQYWELPAKYGRHPDRHGQRFQGISHGQNKSYTWGNFPLLAVTHGHARWTNKVHKLTHKNTEPCKGTKTLACRGFILSKQQIIYISRPPVACIDVRRVYTHLQLILEDHPL